MTTSLPFAVMRKSDGQSSIVFFIALNTWRFALPPMSCADRERAVEAWIRGYAAGRR